MAQEKVAEGPDDILEQALALHRNQKPADAKPIYLELLTRRPDDFWLLYLLGAAECQLGNITEGILLYQRSLELNPRQPKTWYFQGEALKVQNRNEEAVRCYDVAYALNPALELVAGERLHARMHLNAWADFDTALGELERLLATDSPASAPFIVQALLDSPALQLRCATNFTNSMFPAKAQSKPLTPHPRGKRIRLGYFSSDFCSHPVSQLIIGLLEQHDRNKFELFGFSLDTEQDSWRVRMLAAFDHVIDCNALSPAATAAKARSVGIDIAIDLNGYTQGCRTAIFAERAAPIQAGYIGFLGTMGAPYFDYLFADRVLIPAESRQYYTEKIVYLPSYQCNLQQIEVVDHATRRDNNLPEHAVVFCCFNNSFKLTPPVFDAWMQILRQVPDSVLWLYVKNPEAQRNLAATAASAGIAASRLVFASRVGYGMYLAGLRLADVLLDTYPYNAGATASDALRMELPLVTRAGDSFASRMGASLLFAVGLPELVTNSMEEYIRLAVRMGLDRQFRQQIKSSLQAKLPACDLFNTRKFTQSMEVAYSSMYEINQQGHLPGHIFVNTQ